MRTGVSIWSIHPYMLNQEWNHEDFFAFVKEIGAGGVELLTFFLDTDHDVIDHLEKILLKYDVPIGCFSASNDFATYDESLFKKGIDDIKRAVTLADRFGVKVVRIFAGDVKSGINYEQAKKRIVEGLKTVAEEAEKKKIFLGIENHGRLAGKSSQVKELIDTVGSDYIGSTFDMGNFILVGEDPIDAYKTLAKHVVHIHAKDFKKAPDNFEEGMKYYTNLDGSKYVGVMPGEGMVPLQKLKERIKELGYRGWIMVEYEGNEEPTGGTVKSLKALNDLFFDIK